MTDRTGEAIGLLRQISREFMVDVATLRGKGPFTKTPRLVAIRRVYCETGRAMGLSTVELGIAVNRDHSTISYHASPSIRARKKACRPIGRIA